VDERQGTILDEVRFATLFPLLLLLYVPYQFLFFPRVAVIDWYSVASEGFVTLIIMKALTLSDKLYDQKAIYRPLMIGFTLLLFGYITDVLDEFLEQPLWITTCFEDLPMMLGFPCLVYALTQWNKSNQALRSELQEQVVTDYLTGAMNRRGFMERFEHEIQRSQRYGSPLALIWFDLDTFKRVNDQHGHNVGDRVLCAISEATQKVIRKVDIFARMGGEEFCVLMPQTSLAGAGDVAEKLRRAIEECNCPEDVHITASFGVAEYISGEHSDYFLQRADNALYRSKDEGRNKLTLA